MHRYFIIHKPSHMLSQFVGGDKGLRMLDELEYEFPEGIHAIGRLDYHSEGLLLLTTNTRVTKLLFESDVKHERSYLLQAYKAIEPATLEMLRNGTPILIKGGITYITTPCKVELVERPPLLPTGRFEVREDLESTWLQMTLTEGKYRQIRKMLQVVGHPCRRLMRTSIENIELGDLPAGGVLEMEEAEFFSKLNIQYP